MEIGDIPIETPSSASGLSTTTIVAGAIIAGGLVLWLLMPSEEKKASSTASSLADDPLVPTGVSGVVTAARPLELNAEIVSPYRPTQAELDAKYTAEQQYGAGDKLWEQNLATQPELTGKACVVPGAKGSIWYVPSAPNEIRYGGDTVACADLSLLVEKPPAIYDQSTAPSMCPVGDVATDTAGVVRNVDYWIGAGGQQKRPTELVECLKQNQWMPVFKSEAPATIQHGTFASVAEAQASMDAAYYGSVF